MPHRLDMLHLIPTSAGIAALFATGIIIDEKSLVPVGTLGCVFLVAFWIGKKLQKIDDGHSDTTEKLQKIDDRLNIITQQANRMEEAAIRVSNLPCMIEGRICAASEPSKPLKMK